MLIFKYCSSLIQDFKLQIGVYSKIEIAVLQISKQPRAANNNICDKKYYMQVYLLRTIL